MTQWISLSALKTLSSHERGVVWHQFTKVTKEGSYYRVKCNLCSDEDVFLQVRLKTMRYHLWIKHKDFYVENLGEAEEEIALADMSNEVVALKYDDGEEYRTQNPYPEHNDGVYRQEKLNGTRAIKIDLITLFPYDIKLPNLDQL